MIGDRHKGLWAVEVAPVLYKTVTSELHLRILKQNSNPQPYETNALLVQYAKSVIWRKWYTEKRPNLPKFGNGSSSCAGSEKRTEAISATPMNLVARNHKSVSCFS